MSKPRHIAGVMSGTSLDGIDVAIVAVNGHHTDIDVALLAFVEVPFPASIRERLHRASAGDMTLRQAFELEVDLGIAFADAILEASVKMGRDFRLDAIGLHGQTVYHNPRRSPAGLSVQLHGASIVKERLRIPVISDFRSADIAAGGEGAPLVPYCDYLLLRDSDRSRIVLNIGGIANITWLRRGCGLESLIAFDTGPGNMMIDAAMSYLFDRPFDDTGAVAASAQPDGEWLACLMSNNYFASPFPKSTGREEFGRDMTVEAVERARAGGLSDSEIVATCTAMAARSIAVGIRQASDGDVVDQIIVAGGGARNHTLLAMLGNELPDAAIIPSDEMGLPSDAKEAVCFALLADAHLRDEPTNVPSVTGARRRLVLGARW